MALSSDSGGSMLQQHSSRDNAIEDPKSFYTDILLSRMISAANSAAVLAAASNATSVNSLISSKLSSMSSSPIENGHPGTSSRALELSNSTKANKKLSFSVDSLLTSKEKSLNTESIIKEEVISINKQSLKLTEEERAEEEEDLEVDGNESSDLEDGINGENEEDNITIDEEKEARFRIGSMYNSHDSSNQDTDFARKIAVPKPIIPVSQLPDIKTPPNLLAGIAQAMAIAQAANAAASSRFPSLPSSVTITGKPHSSDTPIQTNGLLRPNSGVPSPHLPPGFPLPMGSRPPFFGTYLYYIILTTPFVNLGYRN